MHVVPCVGSFVGYPGSNSVHNYTEGQSDYPCLYALVPCVPHADPGHDVHVLAGCDSDVHVVPCVGSFVGSWVTAWPACTSLRSTSGA